MTEIRPGVIRFLSDGKRHNARAEVWTGTEWIGLWGVKSTTFKRETDAVDEVTIVALCHWWHDAD
jgi:hypothetical protein